MVATTTTANSAPTGQMEAAAPSAEIVTILEDPVINIPEECPPTIDEAQTPNSDLPSDLAKELLQEFINNFHSNLQKCISFLLKSIKTPFTPLKIMLVRSMDNIRDVGRVEQAKALEQLTEKGGPNSMD